MNEFSFDTDTQERNAAELINYQKKRIATQQVIFSAIFLLLAVMLAFYVARKMIYMELDGYVTLDQNRVRAIDDLFVVSIDKSVGDRVKTGDTLYTYVLLRDLFSLSNPVNEPTTVQNSRSLRLQARLAGEEIPVLRTRKAELDKMIAQQASDVYFGLTDNYRLKQLEAERAEVEERLAAQEAKVRAYLETEHTISPVAGEMSKGAEGLGLALSIATHPFISSMLQYCCAPTEAVVTQVNVPTSMFVFRAEDILTLQHTDYNSCHLGIMAYATPEQVSSIDRNDIVTVIINSNVSLKAHLDMVGSRVEELPKHLVGAFSSAHEAIVLYFGFEPGQYIPDWVITDHMPVRIRLNRMERSDFFSNMYYIDAKGQLVPCDSIQHKHPQP